MRLSWNIMSLFWLKILSLETHDAMKCVYKKTNFHNLHNNSEEDLGKRCKYSTQREDELPDTRYVLDCQCSAKSKVIFSIESILYDFVSPSCSEKTEELKNGFNTTVKPNRIVPNVLRLHNCDILEVNFDIIKSPTQKTSLVEQCFQENSVFSIENVKKLYLDKPDASYFVPKFSRLNLQNVTMKTYGNYQNIRMKNINEVTFDNVRINNFDVNLILEDENGSTSLKIASRVNITRHEFDQNRGSIKVVTNNFGLINQYRINLLSILWINHSSEDAFRSASWNVNNFVDFELVLNKFNEFVTEPIVYLFYKTENINQTEANLFTTASLSKDTLYSRLISNNFVPKITPSAIVFDISRKVDEKIENVLCNKTCNCTFYKCLLLRNISMQDGDTSSLVDKNFLNNLTEDEHSYMSNNFSLYISRCKHQCDEIKKEVADLRRPLNIDESLNSSIDDYSTTSNSTANNSKNVVALAKSIPEDLNTKSNSTSESHKFDSTTTEKYSPNIEENTTRNIIPFNNTIDKILTQIWLNVSTELSKVDRQQNEDKTEKSQGNFWNSFSQVLSNKINDQQSSNNSLNTILAGILYETNCCDNENSLSQNISVPTIATKSNPDKVRSTASPNMSSGTENMKSTSEPTTFYNTLNPTEATTTSHNEDPATEETTKQDRKNLHPTKSQNDLLKFDSQKFNKSKSTLNNESSSQEKNENTKQSKSSSLSQFRISSIQSLLFIVFISQTYASVFDFIIT